MQLILGALAIPEIFIDVTARYYAVSDESHITAARYRSIAALSFPIEFAATYDNKVRAVLDQSCVNEFKWHDLNSAKRRFCALKLIDTIFTDLVPNSGRIDVLVWDTHDSRHSIKNRDDDKNFERMYFHLHKQVMLKREPESEWHLRPDEKLGIDWETLEQCLASVGSWRKYYELPLLAEEFSLAQFRVASLKPLQSCDRPICQVADLFAGMAAYSRTRPELISSWSVQETGQHSLLEESAPKFSGVDRERLPVIAHFNRRCKDARAGVSLRTLGYFHTPNPRNPLNFWHYVPQHEADRAPASDG